MPAAIEPSARVVAEVGTFDEIVTLEDGTAHALALTITTPNLAEEMAGTAQELGDLVGGADLPWDVSNEIGQALVSVNADVLGARASDGVNLIELRRIATMINDAL